MVLDEELQRAKENRKQFSFDAMTRNADELSNCLRQELGTYQSTESLLSLLQYCMAPAQLVGYFAHGDKDGNMLRMVFKRSFTAGTIASHLIERGISPALWGLGSSIGCWVEGTTDFVAPSGTLQELQIEALLLTAGAAFGNIEAAMWREAMQAEALLYVPAVANKEEEDELAAPATAQEEAPAVASASAAPALAASSAETPAAEADT